jgi:two-component system, NarL family, nitrate/nitrite response regulator NarL
MPQPQRESQNASFVNHGVNHWNLWKVRGEERSVKLTPDKGPAFRVLIADRDSMSSDLLANALVRDSRCEAVSIQSADLLHALSTCKVDLVVIGTDSDSKSGNVLDLAHAVGRTHPGTYIVILLNHTNHESVINAFRSGARGVFSRQQPMTEFLDCIEHVRKGFIWAGRTETNSLLEAFKSIPAPSLVTASDSPSLTSREMQVVQSAAKGKTNKSIAIELGLSEHTVKNYLFRAFEKLGVSSRVELLFYLTIRGHTFSPAKTKSVDADLSVD